MAEELKDNPGVRVAYDNDGDRWDEQTDEAGVRTGWFKHRPDPVDLDGDELQLWQLVRMYGVARVVPASEDADRDLLLWLHAEAAWKAGSFEAQIADAESEFGSAMDEADRVFETREEGEECSGRDDTGQASREETPGNVSSRRLTTSGVPGPGDGTATPAPPSSRSSSVHPDGGDRG